MRGGNGSGGGDRPVNDVSLGHQYAFPSMACGSAIAATATMGAAFAWTCTQSAIGIGQGTLLSQSSQWLHGAVAS